MIKYITILLLFTSCMSKKEWDVGTDKNSNGVRDDIDAWIVKEFSSNKRLMKAVTYLAKSDPASCVFNQRLKCLNGLTNDPLMVQVDLLEKTLNTKERRDSFDERLKECPKIDERKVKVKCPF